MPPSTSCYTNEQDEYCLQESQDAQDATRPLAAGGLSVQRSPQPQNQPTFSGAPFFSRPVLGSELLPTADDVDILSLRHRESQHSSFAVGDRRPAAMSNLVRILDEALDILKSGDDECIQDDDLFDLSIPFDPTSFFLGGTQDQVVQAPSNSTNKRHHS